MKYLPLILAGLLRKPLRSVLTLLSVLIAFLLFGLLEGINAGFAEVIEAQHLDRLLTDPRVPGGAPMPVAAADKIERVPGVTRVCAPAAFFGAYQDPKNGLFALATDAADWLAVRPEYSMAPEHLRAFQSTRAAIAMMPGLQKRLGLEAGRQSPDQIADRPQGWQSGLDLRTGRNVRLRREAWRGPARNHPLRLFR